MGGVTSRSDILPMYLDGAECLKYRSGNSEARFARLHTLRNSSVFPIPHRQIPQYVALLLLAGNAGSINHNVGPQASQGLVTALSGRGLGY